MKEYINTVPVVILTAGRAKKPYYAIYARGIVQADTCTVYLECVCSQWAKSNRVAFFRKCAHTAKAVTVPAIVATRVADLAREVLDVDMAVRQFSVFLEGARAFDETDFYTWFSQYSIKSPFAFAETSVAPVAPAPKAPPAPETQFEYKFSEPIATIQASAALSFTVRAEAKIDKYGCVIYLSCPCAQWQKYSEVSEFRTCDHTAMALGNKDDCMNAIHRLIIAVSDENPKLKDYFVYLNSRLAYSDEDFDDWFAKYGLGNPLAPTAKAVPDAGVDKWMTYLEF